MRTWIVPGAAVLHVMVVLPSPCELQLVIGFGLAGAAMRRRTRIAAAA